MNYEYNNSVKEVKEKMEKHNVKITDENIGALIVNAIDLFGHIGTSFSIHDIKYNMLLDNKYGEFNEYEKNSI